MYYVGIDLGGTNIATGIVDENYNIIAKANLKTNSPRPAEEIADDMAKTVMMAAESAGIELSEIEFVGVGSPGSIDPFGGIITNASNLQFKNVPIVKMLEERLPGVKVGVENDANAAAYGEMIAGAGRGTNDFIAITLGTGVGGGVIVGGKMLVGSNFSGAEVGHMVILMDGEHCTCGRKGCFEAYASATALIRQTKSAMEANPDSKMWELVDGNIDRTSGRTSFDAMRLGDETAAAVVQRYCEYIGCGVTNMINIFQPEVLCIGGGISNEKETLLAPVRKFVEANRFPSGLEKQTVIKAAELGNDAGIIGAAFLRRLYN